MTSPTVGEEQVHTYDQLTHGDKRWQQYTEAWCVSKDRLNLEYTSFDKALSHKDYCWPTEFMATEHMLLRKLPRLPPLGGCGQVGVCSSDVQRGVS